MFGPNGPTFFELARQALGSTERGYDLLAPKFDYTPFCTPWPILDAVQRRLSELGPYDSALDVCCGTGVGMQMLQPLCRQRITGIDFSQGMLNVARSKLETSTRPAMEFHRGNALEMPYEACFDLAVSFGSFGHFPRADQSRLLEQVAKALRPGGRFVFVTQPKPPILSLNCWLSRSFNAAMHIRNLLIRPPFVMYYLTFLWPQVQTQLEQHGFAVQCHNTFPGQTRSVTMKTVIATRR